MMTASTIKKTSQVLILTLMLSVLMPIVAFAASGFHGLSFDGKYVKGYVYGNTYSQNGILVNVYGPNNQYIGPVSATYSTYDHDVTGSVYNYYFQYDVMNTQVTSDVYTYVSLNAPSLTGSVYETVYAVPTTTVPTLTGIGFNPSSYSVKAGSTVNTVVYAAYSDNTAVTLTSGVTYSSSNTDVATVNAATGEVTGLAAGYSTVITATYQNYSAKATVSVTSKSSTGIGGGGGVGGSDNSGDLKPDKDGKVDGKALAESLVKNLVAKIAISGDSASLPASALVEAAKKDGAAVIVTSDLGTYTLPLSILKLDDLAKALGVSVADLNIKVTVKKVSGDTASGLNSAASANGVKLLADAVDFNVEAVGKDGKSVKVEFGSTYVSRTLNVTSTIDTSNTTGVLYDPDTKTFSFVPSTFETKDGKTVATLKRNGNSIYTVASFNKSFSDIDGHWAKADIQLLANKLVINGATETTFAPDSNITRAEFAALVVRALGLSVDANAASTFSDVKASDWYNGVVAAAAKAGLINGYEDGTFKADKQITREELSALVVRALKFAGVKADVSADQQAQVLAKYTDADKIVWAKAEVAAAINAGIVNGVTDTTVASDKQATRAEAATMLKRFLSKAGFIN